MQIAAVGNLFYFLGVGLTILALIVAFAGIKFKDFPSSRAQIAGGLTLIVVLVASTATFAVILSAHEKEQRNDEKAAELAQGPVGDQGATPTKAGQAAVEAGNVEAGSTSSSTATAPATGEKLPLSSPSSGNLLYDTSKLSAKPGEVTIDYTNPSATPHSVAIEGPDGQAVAEGDIVSGGDQSIATADLKPGKYVFYCTVPGHREAGMQGTLTVK